MATSLGRGPDGIQHYEAMDGPAWKQTIRDVPVAVLASGIGYGIGKTVADYMAPRVLAGKAPALMRALPTIAAGASFATSMAASRLQGVLKERRDLARREAAINDVEKLEKHLAELKQRHGLKVAHLDEEQYRYWGTKIEAMLGAIR